MNSETHAVYRWINDRPFLYDPDILYAMFVCMMIVAGYVIIMLLVKKGFVKRGNVKLLMRLSLYEKSWTEIPVSLIKAVVLAAIIIGSFKILELSFLGLFGKYYFSLPGWMLTRYGLIGAVALFAAVMLAFTFLTFYTAGALAYAVVVQSGLRKFGRLLLAPAAGIVSVSLLYIGVDHSAEAAGDRCGFNDIPGYCACNESYVMAGIADNPALYSYETERVMSNMPALDDFQKGADPRIALREEASWELSQVLRDNMKPRIRIMQTYKSQYLWPDWNYGMWFINFVNVASRKDGYMMLVERMLSEDNVNVEGRDALCLGRIYSRYGDREKAWEWFEKGVMTYPEWRLDDINLAKWAPCNIPEFNSGRVSGRVMLDGMPIRGARVGIRRLNGSGLDVPQEKRFPMRKFSGYEFNNLADATRTNAEGRFSFDGLMPDEYVLFIRLDVLPGYDYVITENPGTITISEDNPSVDIGVVGFGTKKARSYEEQVRLYKEERMKEASRDKQMREKHKKHKKKKKNK